MFAARSHLGRAALALVVLIAAPAGTATAGWRPPVDGGVARAFDLGPDPFEAGRHRGVDLAAPPGTPVRAPCAGPVVVAGRVGTSGRVVTLRCGPWRVSHMPLGALAVRPGDAVRRGGLLGTVAASRDHTGLHVGVRRAGTRFGYVDPTRFLSAADAAPPVIAGRPSPRVRIARPPRLGPAPRAAPRPAVIPEPIAVLDGRPLERPAPTPALHRTSAASAAGSNPASAAGSNPASAGSNPASAGSNPASATGSSPAGGGEVAPWPAWAGLALILAGLSVRWRWRPPPRRASRPAALPGKVR